MSPFETSYEDHVWAHWPYDQHLMASQTFITYSLSEWIIGIYLHEFTNNEQDISIPHEAGVLQISRSLLVNECR